MTYKLGSLFDGSGGFPLAGSLCGITPCWAAEVEPYPIAVTRSRFPSMKHLGDISKINGAEIEPVDIITFGSPCQDLSVAGKRAGLKHEANGDEETTRSGLFMEAVRIIKEMRRATNGKYPSFALWENVPGAFSSNKGEDFRIVCEELIKIVEPKASMPAVPKNGWPYADSYCGDGWSLAYRVFDAQYWGVPQRRRRIHLVLDLRGERAREVLFEREGVRGYFATGRTPWQGTASHVENGTGADDREGESGNCLTPWDVQSRRIFTVDGPWPALYGGEGGGHGYAFIPTPIIDSIGGQAERGWVGKVAPTLKASHYKFPPCVTVAAGFKPSQGSKAMGIGWENEISPTLLAGQEPGVCIKAVVYDARGNGNGEIVSTLTGDHENRITDYTSVVVEPIPSYVDTTHADDVVRVDDVVAPLQARDHKGGKLICQPVISLQGNTIDRDAKQNGSGVCEDVAHTLNAVDRHGVAFAMQGFGDYKESEVASGLKARDYKDATDLVCGVDCRNMNEYPELYPTLQAKPNGGQSLNFSGAVRVCYIVRRLTPTECARLQGFADHWGDIDQKEDFTEEEYRFWLEVRNTHATVIGGKEAKEYTKSQMLTWYNKLHTDSAEYKMWGNGIALPPALYVMQGIRDALDVREETNTNDVQEETHAPVVAEETACVEPQRIIAVATQQGGAEISENGICPTITAAAGMSGNNQPWICIPVAQEEPTPLHEEEKVERELTKSDLISAYAKLYKHRDHLTRQQIRTLKGQIKAGDVEGAMNGLKKLLRREE